MIQKWLRYLLIGKVQEYYFINFTIVTIIYFVFHPLGVKTFFFEQDDSFGALFALPFFVVTFLVICWGLIKKNHLNYAPDDLIITMIGTPTLILSGIGIIAVTDALEAKTSLLEITLVTYLLLRHVLRFGILLIFYLFGRFDMTKNRIYKSILKRLHESLGKYQTSLLEVTTTAFVLIPTVYLLSVSSLGHFAQFLLAFSIAGLTASGLQKIRGSLVIRN